MGWRPPGLNQTPWDQGGPDQGVPDRGRPGEAQERIPRGTFYPPFKEVGMAPAWEMLRGGLGRPGEAWGGLGRLGEAWGGLGEAGGAS